MEIDKIKMIFFKMTNQKPVLGGCAIIATVAGYDEHTPISISPSII